MSTEETTNQNEQIAINGKLLEYGVLANKEGGYQVYLYPGMTVAEIAFDVMTTIRLLEMDNYISKDEFLGLVDKYYNDPQYAPLITQEAESEEN